ncbi:hypothetical protein BC835DRAFT_1422217 [Cytidiella melzeri]|nr:hypothetical protein BC835DRAFT_1422217 [Cytidiella melzeri]
MSESDAEAYEILVRDPRAKYNTLHRPFRSSAIEPIKTHARGLNKFDPVRPARLAFLEYNTLTFGRRYSLQWTIKRESDGYYTLHAGGAPTACIGGKLFAITDGSKPATKWKITQPRPDDEHAYTIAIQDGSEVWTVREDKDGSQVEIVAPPDELPRMPLCCQHIFVLKALAAAN